MKELFTNPRLKKIVNVYQLQYTNGFAPGLGDYIRGSICLYQICKFIGIEFDMVINHPMSKYLVNHQNPPTDIDYENIEFYAENNFLDLKGDNVIKNSGEFYKNLINKINNIESETFYMLCNAFPIWTTGDECFSKIRNSIAPISDIRCYVYETLMELKMPIIRYSVLHIRTGDNVLLHGKRISPGLLKKIIYTVYKYTRPDKKYIILSDNNNLKNYLNKYKRFSSYTKEIAHLGETNNKSDTGVKNTLLDFYVMSKASNIISLTTYKHGSGFSEWCSKIYKIPYKCFIL
jgi:hypothetical protein